jgi:hypothetical protein
MWVRDGRLCCCRYSSVIAGPWVVVSALIGRLLDMTHDFPSFLPFLFNCFRLVQDVNAPGAPRIADPDRRSLAQVGSALCAVL